MKRRRTNWKTGLRLAVGVLLLAWVFHGIFLEEGRRFWIAEGRSWQELSRWERWKVGWTKGPIELGRTVGLVNGKSFALSLVFMGMTVFLGMLRWRRVLRVQGIELSLGRTAEISLVAHFANSFLLGSTGGDLFKAYYVAQETHHKKTEAVLTVAVDRLLGLFAMLLFACLMMVPNLGLLSAHPRLAVLAWLIVLMFIACGSLVVLAFSGGFATRWSRGRAWLGRLPKGELAVRIVEACRQFGRQRRFLGPVLGLSMALNLFCVLQIWSLARGLDLDVPVITLFAVVPIIVCVSALPITPSGLGVRENLYVFMLAVPEIGVEQTRALSLSLLAYAGSLIWSIVGGVVYMTRKEQHHLPELQTESTLAENLDQSDPSSRRQSPDRSNQ